MYTITIYFKNDISYRYLSVVICPCVNMQRNLNPGKFY